VLVDHVDAAFRGRIPVGLARPSKIFGLGYNYPSPKTPTPPPTPRVVHMKPTTAVIGPDDTIVLPPQSSMVVAEPELGVVIGRRCRQVDLDDVDEFVLGLVCVNDVTAWDLFLRDGDFVAAKAFDTFAPIGPEIVAGLDIDTGRAVSCRVDGQIAHETDTKLMHYGAREVVHHISHVCTLLPGDVISLGSPGPAGEHIPLRPGSTVEVEIEGIGILRNSVAAPTYAGS
jgi:2-keto-4-pentenoate hydratase/2-oxohepta-3-ene-1,7-dioic acid hydratase in catechol pathway